ncbi:hypothetical protein BS50DRAFT_509921, partial [Corynespora cassiicola Philippines]
EPSKKHGVVRSTLTPTCRCETRSREEQAIAQRELTPQQKTELVEYIDGLKARHVPPARETKRNLALSMTKEPVSESRVTRLTSQYSTDVDSNHHSADSYTNYKL